MSFIGIPSGALAASASVIATGRIAACGHTYEHWLHWIHFVASQTGTSTAIPRFSNADVPEGVCPISYFLVTDTGIVLPC